MPVNQRSQLWAALMDQIAASEEIAVDGFIADCRAEASETVVREFLASLDEQDVIEVQDGTVRRQGRTQEWFQTADLDNQGELAGVGETRKSR